MTAIPEIIAHRGASRESLENTLDAFQRAVAQGADAIELDVHATRDGMIVVHHDETLLVEATHGPGQRRPIAALDADTVRRSPLKNGAPAPGLDDVLALVNARAVVYVEVKATGIEHALLACLDRHPSCRVAVHAFDHRIPVAVRAKRPELPIGVLSSSYPLTLSGFIGPAAPDAFWQHATLIDEQLVRDTHALGARLIAWTVNDAAHARSLAAMGVDALCTDIPGLLRSALLA